MGNKLPIVKNLALDYSSENVLTIYSNGDNSYNTITNLNRRDLNLKKIWIGNFQCFGVDIYGNFLSWGLNDYYQIGNGKKDDYLFNNGNKKIDSFSYLSITSNTNYYIKKLNIFKNNFQFPFYGKQVKKVECGDGFSLFLLDNGQLYGVGRGDKGQLGWNFPFEEATIVSSKKCLSNVTLNQYFSNKKIYLTNIYCGSDFCFAKDDKNIYYSWGNNDHHQLCRETFNFVSFEPEIVENLIPYKNIQKICLGWMHGNFLSAQNENFIWGNPFYDYDNEFKDYKIPTKIDYPEDLKIIDISCGFHHICALVVENDVCQIYTFGANDFGQLGYNIKSKLYYSTEPKRVIINDDDPNAFIVELSTGAFHTVVRMNNNNIWGFGQNDNKQLGKYNGEHISWPVKWDYKTDEKLFFYKIICANGSTSVIKIPHQQKLNSIEDEEKILIINE